MVLWVVNYDMKAGHYSPDNVEADGHVHVDLIDLAELNDCDCMIHRIDCLLIGMSAAERMTMIGTATAQDCASRAIYHIKHCIKLLIHSTRNCNEESWKNKST